MSEILPVMDNSNGIKQAVFSVHIPKALVSSLYTFVASRWRCCNGCDCWELLHLFFYGTVKCDNTWCVVVGVSISCYGPVIVMGSETQILPLFIIIIIIMLRVLT